MPWGVVVVEEEVSVASNLRGSIKIVKKNGIDFMNKKKVVFCVSGDLRSRWLRA